ncbi:MAG: bifunctional nicotinamidase/pyrazinamidase [Chlamydiota bacterium]|nr:bifunctional nicotinamidase/pyrazinamidase [Chlamydiota bacterium]
MKALLIVDMQNDFLPGGALAVNEGDQIIPTINHLIESGFDLVVASKDWHPESHSSFASTHAKAVGTCITLGNLEQMLWPNHCVQGTKGADLSSELNVDAIDFIVHKGIDEGIDSYSAFFDNGHVKSTGLTEQLKRYGVDTVYVVGVATDYCVKYSVLDSIKEGFTTYLVLNACKGVNLKPNDSLDAIKEMQAAGAIVIETSNTYLK